MRSFEATGKPEAAFARSTNRGDRGEGGRLMPVTLAAGVDRWRETLLWEPG
jgi:hypothetical protein